MILTCLEINFFKRKVDFFSNFEVCWDYWGKRKWAPKKFDKGKNIVTGRKPVFVIIVVVWGLLFF